MNFRSPAFAISCGLAAIWMLFCLWLWQPERQVRKHQEHFIRAAESRNWKRFAESIDARYTDRWGHDKALVLRDSREVLGQFFALAIESTIERCDVNGANASVAARLKVAGSGTSLAAYAKDEVNRLTEPFVFEWTRQSWKPWDWTLTRVDQRELRINRGGDFFLD